MTALYQHRSALLFALVFGVVLVSCDQAGVSKKRSPEQARDRIESALDGLAESMRTLEQGAFSTAVKDFLGLEEGTATSGEWAARLGKELKSVIEIDDSRFHFDESTGRYAWDADQQEWVQTDSAEAIVLHFPAEKGDTSNTATLTVGSYSDRERTVGGESVYVPVSADASLTVDSSEVFSLALSDAEYTSLPGAKFPIPISFSLDVLTAPHTHDVQLQRTPRGRYAFSAETRNDDQRVAGLTATLERGSSLERPVGTVSGEGRIGPSLTLPYTIEVDSLMALDDPSEEQVNALVDARVAYDGEQIATLRYDGEKEEVQVVYPDGTVDPAASFYEDFLDELRSIWSDYLGSEADSTVQDAASTVFSKRTGSS